MGVSIIVPVYNAKKYLQKCFQSLYEQTYQDIEIIFVDDGSTDGSSDILDNLKRQFNNVKVIHKANGGLSSARNAGLEIASKEYVFFLDSDDWLDSDYVESCMNKLEDHKTDILLTPYILEYKNNPVKIHLFSQSKFFFEQSEVHSSLLLKLFGPSDLDEKDPGTMSNLNTAWGKFYNRKLIGNIRFSDRRVIGTAEDLWFNIQVFYLAKNAQYLEDKFLHYNKTNEGSLVSSYHSDMGETQKNLFLYMNGFIEKHNLGNTYEQALNNRIVLSMFSQMLNLNFSSMSVIDKYKICYYSISAPLYRKAMSRFSFSNMPLIWKYYFQAVKKKKILLVLLLTKAAEKLRKKRRR